MRLRQPQGSTHFWFCSISSRADKADVPFLPCGGATGSVGYGESGLVTWSPLRGALFCCTGKKTMHQCQHTLDSVV